MLITTESHSPRDNDAVAVLHFERDAFRIRRREKANNTHHKSVAILDKNVPGASVTLEETL